MPTRWMRTKAQWHQPKTLRDMGGPPPNDREDGNDNNGEDRDDRNNVNELVGVQAGNSVWVWA
jgi:hypothetical protein